MNALAVAPTPAARRRQIRRKLPEPAKPFTLAHFRAWASDLILDTGESWRLDPFQEAFVEDHFAGFSECWLVVPEGNGKTTLIGGIGLYHCEHREYANVPVAASSREQAEIMYRQMEGFVLRSPRLHQLAQSEIQRIKGKLKRDVPRFVTLEGYRRINHYQGGRIQIMAADDRTGDGGIPTLAILDELHRHRDLSLYRTWAGKLVKRNGQLVAISTAGEPSSEFEQTRAKIRQTANLERKGSFTRATTNRVVLHEWAVPENGDVENMKVVKAANPFSGVTLALLTEKYASPTMTLSHWRRFVCNVPTRAENAAITEAEWEAAKVADAIPVGERIALGLDVAWKWDTTAAVPLWMRDPDYRLFGPASVLTPPRDGSMLHPDAIKLELSRIHDRNPVETVVMDMSKAEDLAAWIEDTLGATVIDRGTSNQFAAQDCERFMDALRTGRLKHTGDAALTQHVMNAVTRDLPSGDTRFDRPAEARISSEQERRVIDALSAASMVHGVVAVMEPVEEPVPLVAWR